VVVKSLVQIHVYVRPTVLTDSLLRKRMLLALCTPNAAIYSPDDVQRRPGISILQDKVPVGHMAHQNRVESRDQPARESVQYNSGVGCDSLHQGDHLKPKPISGDEEPKSDK
jgi:hypothetical protein